MSSPFETPIRYEWDRGPRSRIPPEQWEAFLDEVRLSGNQVLAAQRVGISFTSVYLRRKQDPDFNTELEVALQQAGHILLARAWERALEKSDPLMLRLLEAYLPDTFSRDRKVDVQVTHRPPIHLTAEEHAALAPIARRLLVGSAPGYVDDAEWYADEPAAEETPATENTEP